MVVVATAAGSDLAFVGRRVEDLRAKGSRFQVFGVQGFRGVRVQALWFSVCGLSYRWGDDRCRKPQSANSFSSRRLNVMFKPWLCATIIPGARLQFCAGAFGPTPGLQVYT